MSVRLKLVSFKPYYSYEELVNSGFTVSVK